MHTTHDARRKRDATVIYSPGEDAKWPTAHYFMNDGNEVIWEVIPILLQHVYWWFAVNWKDIAKQPRYSAIGSSITDWHVYKVLHMTNYSSHNHTEDMFFDSPLFFLYFALHSSICIAFAQFQCAPEGHNCKLMLHSLALLSSRRYHIVSENDYEYDCFLSESEWNCLTAEGES